MYRHRKKNIRKGMKLRVADRNGAKTMKNDGNPNIMSKRLTLPPGFSSLGIKSEIVEKRRKNSKKRESILTEDLHGLFYTHEAKRSTPLRRSSRIFHKKDPQNFSASDYYEILTGNSSAQESHFDSEPKQERNFKNYKLKTIQRNNSKSLFRQINKKYAQVGSQNIIRTFSKNSIPDSSSRRVNSEFCSRLAKQLSICLNQKALIQSKYRTVQYFETINNILSGTLSPKEMIKSNNKDYKKPIIQNDPVDIDFNYIPRSQWVYTTPPRQKINLPKIEECQIQPAVIYSTKKQSTIYELQSNVDIDLSNYCDMQDISIDNRHLKYVSNFGGDMSEVVDTNHHDSNKLLNSHIVLKNCPKINYLGNHARTCDKDCDFIRPLDEKEKMFSFVTSRPKKTVERLSRISSVMKCKLDKHMSNEQYMYEHNEAGGSNQTLKQSKEDITFIEDNGKYRIVNSQNTAENANFTFEFKRKLFHDEQDQNMFAFKKQDSKLFDFSHLKSNDC